jgi:hypothetical protein
VQAVVTVRSDTDLPTTTVQVRRGDTPLIDFRTDETFAKDTDEDFGPLTEMSVCVRLEGSYVEDSPCAGCPPRREYYDIIPLACQPMALSMEQPTFTAEHRAGGITATIFVTMLE